MKVVVYGMWHLGCVTAACLAKHGHEVIGLECDPNLIRALNEGRPPIHEPGLAELIATECRRGTLRFSDDPQAALAGADILWVAFDTPVDDNDVADVPFVRSQLESIADAIEPGTRVLVSSQVPAGFSRGLSSDWNARGLRFAVSPENLRLGKAIDAFLRPERVIVGLEDQSDRADLELLFASITDRIEWMSLESAEMTKHALNAFLATSITFINELSRICEVVGADAKEVERGLKSEGRIGPKAYLTPGGSYAGGTLARDIGFLIGLADEHAVGTPLFHGVKSGNDLHRDWLQHRVMQSIAGVPDPTVAVLGLTYKPGTDTLRRSPAIELCRKLKAAGIRVKAFDPAVAMLPEEHRELALICSDIDDTLRDADVAVIATEWPEFRAITPGRLIEHMRFACLVDANHFLSTAMKSCPGVRYHATGISGESIFMQPTRKRSA